MQIQTQRHNYRAGGSFRGPISGGEGGGGGGGGGGSLPLGLIFANKRRVTKVRGLVVDGGRIINDCLKRVIL